MQQQLLVALPAVWYPIVFQSPSSNLGTYQSFHPSFQTLWSHGKAITTIIALLLSFFNNNDVRSCGLGNMVSPYGHIPQYLTFFVFHHNIRLVIIPFLTSAQVMLTGERPVDQPGNIVVSSLVLFLCQVLALTNNVVYCFTLLAIQPSNWEIHWFVDVELNIVCSQCLLILGLQN